MVPLLSANWCRAHHVALLDEGLPCRVAVLNDSDELLLEKIKIELGNPATVEKRDAAEIRRLQAQCNDLEESPFQENAADSWESEPIVNLVDTLLDEALEQGASDIHLEPGEGQLRVRFRKDGLLDDYRTLPQWSCDPVLVRLKILSEIDITEKRIPQDGSFCYNGFRHAANIRVSTLPVQGGEKCVLRLLPTTEKNGSPDHGGLDSLKLGKPSRDFLRQTFNSPQGIFLVTGPTGSGKTTTLHAGLQEILHRKINVTTIEDPVEYPLEGAAQVQVNEKCGFTFSVALRALLRQDPDVILVGEIRDRETAQIALRAAQTGHLVLSTLHTNSARAAFTRLEDLGIPPKLLRESLLGIMAQRLVRLRPGSGFPYSGRRAVTEILRPDGTFVEGTLQENALRLIEAGLTDKAEVERVMGK